MATRLSTIKEDRLSQIKNLQEQGINPYPSKIKLEGDLIDISRARELMDKKVLVAGKVWSIRKHGGVVFADLKDLSGAIQLLFQKKLLQDNFKLTNSVDTGDILAVEGDVMKTQAGEITVNVTALQILSKAVRPLPSTWHGLKDVEERYRQRYVDLLINPDVREVFEKRSKIVTLLRSYLDKRGFLEVETPVLQPIYGGATAKPFKTYHNSLGLELYLRISNELYLKRLIVGGFEKVYEISTDFRNEGMDRWHNPEFSMLEFYWAYADYNDLMDMTEDMLSKVAKEVAGDYKIKYGDKEVDFSVPWKRITYHDAILHETGIDIDKQDSVESLKKAIREKNIDADIKEAVDIPTILDALYKATVRPNIKHPTFLIDHPYEMRPLAKRHEDNPGCVESLQLVVAGAELINAYSELNIPHEQRARWEEELERAKGGAQEYQVIDEDYIRALEYGMPPTAGWGLGIDRLTAILTDQHSLKDVILFPTLRPDLQIKAGDKIEVKEEIKIKK